MNRIGLLIALAIAAFVGFVFGLYPELDLELSALFFHGDRSVFTTYYYPRSRLLRDATMWLIASLLVPALVALTVKLMRSRQPLLVSGRAIVFLLATLALGPGLAVNAGFKDHWSRSRPADVSQFGGAERFTAWWDPRGSCPKNCSFVTGDGAAAFWTLAPAALAPPAWRPAAYAAALAFGSAVSLLRMISGGHFFTDVVGAGVIVFLIVWLMHGLIYRWPRTRISDAAIENAIDRLLARCREVMASLAGRRWQRP